VHILFHPWKIYKPKNLTTQKTTLTKDNQTWGLTFALSQINATRGVCNTLQHTATHCNTLQHTATHMRTYICPFTNQCNCTESNITKKSPYKTKRSEIIVWIKYFWNNCTIQSGIWVKCTTQLWCTAPHKNKFTNTQTSSGNSQSMIIVNLKYSWNNCTIQSVIWVKCTRSM